ncbi:MAG TPA: hypothetical protein VFK02_04775 [Kofleriaceae bacterium]|nr:hypothetical protein [Kofleriaceae bacterium]
MNGTVQVVADTHRLDAGVLGELGAVCARAAAEVLPWGSLASSRPILIVGALGRGERQIPAPLLEVANARGAAVLLLSDDPLVRPVVSTHGGRVTLVAPSVTRPRLRGTIRMLLARHGGFAREQLEHHVWTAAFGSAAPAPVLLQDPGGAVTAVFPFDPGWSGAEPLSVEAHQIVAAGKHLDEEERQIRLRELFGSVAGMVHLSRDAREWTLYWPSPAHPVLLCSVQRLPAMCNLAAHADAQIVHLAASPGDVVLGLTSRTALPERPFPAGDGGAALLDELEAHAGGDRAGPAGVIVEIR